MGSLVTPEAARTAPALFANYASNGTMLLPRHLKLIHSGLLRVFEGKTKRLMIAVPPRHGKALWHKELCATPAGWATIGELKVGDKVFGRDGRPCNVIAVKRWEDRPLYNVVTDDRETIVADEEHEWEVRLDRKRPVFKTYTTGKLAARTSPRNPMILQTKPLDLPDAVLPHDPWNLGYWIGNGFSNGQGVQAGGPIGDGDQDQEWVRAKLEEGGWDTSDRSARGQIGLLGLAPELQAIGKKIPAEYFRASINQRRALLQGLIDSDGHVHPDGQVEFCSVRKELALQVQELVWTFGVKAFLSEERATLNGRDTGPKFRVTFYMAGAASLPRKAALCRDNERTPNRYVQFTARNERGPTVCIEVDSPDHMFLVGRSLLPTHNSELTSHYFPAWWIGVKPDTKIMLTTFDSTFSEKWGGQVRNLLEEHGPKVFGVKIRDDTRSKAEWVIEKHGGGMVATGIGGAITGRGANCCYAGTKIRTQAGDRNIEDIRAGDVVLSMDRLMGIPQWKPVLATNRRFAPGGPLRVVAESGHQVNCTPDHPFYVGDGVYREARVLRGGHDELTVLSSLVTPTLYKSRCKAVLEREERGFEVVYDIQVADNNNFFANGILVHNCLIIDDPHKNGQEANSVAITDSVFEWYRSTARTRLEPDGSIILIQCVAKGAMILMADGEKKPIERVVPGDLVLSWVGSGFGARRVVAARKSGRDKILRVVATGGYQVRVNPRHPFLNVDRGWVRAQHLQKGDRVRVAGGDFIEWIKEIHTEDEDDDVYDLTIEETENFVAGGFVVHNTRWSGHDLAARLLQDEANGGEKWEKIILPAIAEENDALGRQPGEALWPQRYNEQHFKDLERSVGSYVFGALYQQRPAPLGGGLFKKAWLRYFRELPDGKLDVSEGLKRADIHMLRKFATVDLAISKKDTADYSAISVFGQDRDGRLFMLDMERGRKDGPDLVPWIKEVTERWGCMGVWIEKVQFQALVIQLARKAGVPVRELIPKGDKIARAIPATALMEGERFFLRKPASWLGVAEEELLSFPTGAHDDIVDTISYAAQVNAGLLTPPILELPDTEPKKDPMADYGLRSPGDWGVKPP